MVATEMMQRYKKLQFERGESTQKRHRFVTDNSSVCGQRLPIADTCALQFPREAAFLCDAQKNDGNPVVAVPLLALCGAIQVIHLLWMFLLLNYATGLLQRADWKGLSRASLLSKRLCLFVPVQFTMSDRMKYIFDSTNSVFNTI